MASNFWSWRRKSPSTRDTDGATALAPMLDLEQVELYTSDGMVLGLVAPEGERMSDILNRQRALLVHGARQTAYGATADAEPTARISSYDSDQILLAMPPAHAGNPARRIHRKRHRVQLDVGPFRVMGTAHIPPGSTLDPYLLRTRTSFVAVTDAVVRFPDDPTFERLAEVVLVNTAAITAIDQMLTLT
jgi:hypothetical protein